MVIRLCGPKLQHLFKEPVIDQKLADIFIASQPNFDMTFEAVSVFATGVKFTDGNCAQVSDSNASSRTATCQLSLPPGSVHLLNVVLKTYSAVTYWLSKRIQRGL